MAVLTATLLVIAAIASRRGAGTWLNAGSMASLSWLLAFALCALPGAMLPSLSDKTSNLVAGVAIASLIGFAPFVYLSAGRHITVAVDVAVVRKWHLFLLCLLSGYVMLDLVQQIPVIQSLGGWGVLWQGFGSGASFRSASIDARLEAVASGENGLTGALGYVLFIGEVSLLSGAILWRVGHRALALAPLIILAGRSFVTLDRTKFVIALLIFILCVGVVSRVVVSTHRQTSVANASSNGQRRHKRLLASLIVSGVTAGALLAPLQARNAGTDRATGVESLMQYVMSSVAGLNIALLRGPLTAVSVDSQTGLVGDFPGYGAYTFFGFFDLLQRFGLETPRAPRYHPFELAALYDEPFTTNTKTLLWNLAMDFGGVGGGIALVGLFALCGLAFFLSTRGKPEFILPGAVIGAALVWSFFGNSVFADFHYIVLAITSVPIAARWFTRPDGGQERMLGVENARDHSTLDS